LRNFQRYFPIILKYSVQSTYLGEIVRAE
jgi:hypothetical protein